MKIYDCSNSDESIHRVGMGPKDNDIMMSLKKYAHLFDCEYVDDYKKSDVIITNDVFPKEIQNLDIPKVKRMDGIYWQNEFTFKNENLNYSAQLADHVIFISEYSKLSLKNLYPNVQLKNSSVVLNWCDGEIFKSDKRKNRKPYFVASASDWSRKEKRFDKIIEFAKNIEEELILIGKCDKVVPKNVQSTGYFYNYGQINNILNHCYGFVNFSYRDAAPKVVCQSGACGLPVLYSDSGGSSEIVDFGVNIKDDKSIGFNDDVYDLDMNDIMSSYDKFKKEYFGTKFETKRDFMDTMNGYFEIIKNI